MLCITTLWSLQVHTMFCCVPNSLSEPHYKFAPCYVHITEHVAVNSGAYDVLLRLHSLSDPNYKFA
jgi:hypothetical protein